MTREQELEEAFLAGYWLHLNSENNDLATRKAKFSDWLAKRSVVPSFIDTVASAEVTPEEKEIKDLEFFKTYMMEFLEERVSLCDDVVKDSPLEWKSFTLVAEAVKSELKFLQSVVHCIEPLPPIQVTKQSNSDIELVELHFQQWFRKIMFNKNFDSFKRDFPTLLKTIIKSHLAILNKTCPCNYTPAPCSPNCSCANPFMSGGCEHCAGYGSMEQRKVKALALHTSQERLVAGILNFYNETMPEGKVELWQLVDHSRAFQEYLEGFPTISKYAKV